MNKQLTMRKIKTWLNKIDLTDQDVTEYAINNVHKLINDYILSDTDTGHKINESGFRIPLYVSRSQNLIFRICQMYFGVQGDSRIIYNFQISKYKPIQKYFFYGLSLKPEIAAQTYKIFMQQMRIIGMEYSEQNLKNEKSVNIRNYRLDRFCYGFLVNFFNQNSQLELSQEEQQQLKQYRVNSRFMPLNMKIADVDKDVEDRSQHDFDAGIDYFIHKAYAETRQLPMINRNYE